MGYQLLLLFPRLGVSVCFTAEALHRTTVTYGQ